MSIAETDVKKNNGDDFFIDDFLRPKSWEGYIGQETIKKNLKIILMAAKKRKEAADHLLFYGQAGLGKTTLAYLVAKEMEKELKITSGPAIERAGDLAALLSDLEPGDFLFIDEAHRIGRLVEEMLYPAMESGKIHLVIGKGMGAKMISLDLPPFTLIAATTRLNLLSAPLRSRFGAIFRLDYYQTEEIEKIIYCSADLLGIKIEAPAVSILAKASRFTPRIANRLLKRSRDFAEVNNLKVINTETTLDALNLFEVDALGLEAHDRRLLEIILKKFNNRPVGINTLAAALGEEKKTIEEIYEPYLMKIGLIQKTPAGRIATDEARRHLEG
ncbi:MAG: Holliday junction branch migration DNA helicase RuvB [Patescibacteria group bacterium]